MKEFRKIEIFSGTGGVGKTTLSASRALYLAGLGYKVLLITIDPAKRLKQVLNLPDKLAGEVQPVNGAVFDSKYDQLSLDALLLSPYHTLKRIADSAADSENSILKVLTRPTGGMNEIMAIVELQYQFEANKYDIIILDTPPGKHFLDFLMATGKIKSFFSKTYMDIFNYLGKNIHPESDKSSKKQLFRPLKSLVTTGVNKLLGYLESVTGTNFVHEFIDAIVTIYRNKNAFLAALQFQDKLKDPTFSSWFLVTSVEQLKVHETELLQTRALELLHGNNALALNKCVSPHFKNWHPKDPGLNEIRAGLLDRENKLKNFAKDFTQVLEFPEIISVSPQVQVSKLAMSWEHFKEN